jgi:hypothetical protein
MRKATQRRERRLLEHLQHLLASNPLEFDRFWHLLLAAWCREAAARGRRLSADVLDKDKERVFALVEKAERMLRGVGGAAYDRVGRSTHVLLGSACAGAVAAATDPRLYRLQADSLTRSVRVDGGFVSVPPAYRGRLRSRGN